MDEIDELSDLPTPRFIWGFAIAVTPSGEVSHDEFEYLTHTRVPRFTCRVVELEDAPAEPEDEGDIDGRIVPFDNPKRMFYITDLGLALMNFTLFDKVDNKTKLKNACDQAIADWLTRREFLDSEPDDDEDD